MKFVPTRLIYGPAALARMTADIEVMSSEPETAGTPTTEAASTVPGGSTRN